MGATSMVKSVSAIVASVIAFMSVFSFFDAIVQWLFAQITLENFGIAVGILSLIYFPQMLTIFKKLFSFFEEIILVCFLALRFFNGCRFGGLLASC